MGVYRGTGPSILVYRAEGKYERFMKGDESREAEL